MVWQFWGRAARGVLSVFAQGAFSCPRRPLIALGNVSRASDEFQQIPKCVQDRMANDADVFDGAGWKKDSKFHFVIRFFNDGSLDYPLPPGSILRMNAPQSFSPTGHALCLIETVFAIPFLGQIHRVSSRQPPNPTSRMRERLGFRKITLASPQLFFKALAFGDCHA